MRESASLLGYRLSGGSTGARLVWLSNGKRAVEKIHDPTPDPLNDVYAEAGSYELDGLLGYHRVPVTVVIPGKPPRSLQYFIAGSKSGSDLNIEPYATDPSLMLFDALIDNFDRNPGNIVVSKQDGRLYAIDNSFAFSTKELRAERIEFDRISRDDLQDFYARLMLATPHLIRDRLGHTLSSARISALLRRREALLNLVRQHLP